MDSFYETDSEVWAGLVGQFKFYEFVEPYKNFESFLV